MKINQRAYAGEADKQRMAWVSQASAAHNLHTIDLPYRLSSWAFDEPANIGLWVDEAEQLIAWAVLQTPMWVIDYAHLPSVDPARIHDQIFAWADARARQSIDTPYGHPIWFVNLREDQHERRRLLEAAGFADQSNVAEDSWRKVFLRRSAQAPIAAQPLPDGVIIRPLAGAGEVDAYVALHQAAFGSTNMTQAWRQRVLQRPEYVADCDLVAATADGKLVAFCIGWFAAAGADGHACGQIEPMGVHPDLQRQGLGRAILAEALDRLYRHGATYVSVESDLTDDGTLAFYQSMGFQIADQVLVYRKDYPAAAG